MQIVKIERYPTRRSSYDVTIRHSWLEWLFGFSREETRTFIDTGRNYPVGGSVYEDEFGNVLEPFNEFSEAIDNWRKAESLKRGL